VIVAPPRLFAEPNPTIPAIVYEEVPDTVITLTLSPTVSEYLSAVAASTAISLESLGEVPVRNVNVVVFGSHELPNVGAPPFPAAGKTGTTSENEDTWFVGYTPLLSTAVWVGFSQKPIPVQRMTVNGHYWKNVFGASIAGPTWKRFMVEALNGAPNPDFSAPDQKLVFGEKVPVPSVVGRSEADAKKILTDAGYTISGTTLKNKAGETVPPLRFSFTTGNALREATGEVVQNELAPLGIQVTITPIKSLGGTLSSGDFDMIIFAWVGSPFLAGAFNQWGSTGGSDYNHYSNPQVDDILTQVKTTLDYNKVYDLLNQADTLMAADASVLPLFQKPVFLAVSNKFVNIRNNANSSGPAYNIQDWGLKAAA